MEIGDGRLQSVEGGLERLRVTGPAFRRDQLEPRCLGGGHDLALAVDDGDKAEVVSEEQDRFLRDQRAKLEASDRAENVDAAAEALGLSDDDQAVEPVCERVPVVGGLRVDASVVEELDAVGQVLGDAVEPALPVGIVDGLGGGADVDADRSVGTALCGDAVHGRDVAALLLGSSEGLHIQGITMPGHLRRMHSAHDAFAAPRMRNGAGECPALAPCQAVLTHRRHGLSQGVDVGSQGGSVSLNKIHSDMAKPREVELRGTAADLTREGLDMMQGTRTRREAHTKVPAVAAMSRPSLRLGAVFVFPRHSACGRTSAPEGGEMV